MSIGFNRRLLEFQGITEEEIIRWTEIYQKDVRRELLKMREWLIANPKRRYRNYHRFIVNWLSNDNRKTKKVKITNAPNVRIK